MRPFLFACILALLPTATWASGLVFATERYPPYSYTTADGRADGAGVEIVRRIMRDLNTGTNYRIELMPWARAIALAETQANHCVFPAARTVDREQRFHWISPILTEENFLVAREDLNVDFRTLKQALDYTVATQRGDFTERLLKKHGFSRIDVSNTFELSLNKLLAGRVDLMPMFETVFNKLVDEGARLKKVLPLADEQLGIACNRRISPQLIARMQATLDTMRGSGIRDAIFQKYGLKPAR
ncbi:substrate-binding periplasmic protein [Rhizobium helianthi]|uniref:Substrate-binding periplasmic protein n=1 Tax=Rhizobium helianthi TaxID=1132695 RepID=A0ABW4M6X4_9HYPH